MAAPGTATRAAGIAMLLLLSACGQAVREDADPVEGASTPPPDRSTGSSPTATGNGGRPRPESTPFCAAVEMHVKVIYTIHARPTTAGQELWVTLTVRNGMSRSLYVQIGGAVGVTEVNAGSAPLLLWGGSSADLVKVRAGKGSTHEVSGLWPQRLSVPEGARVSGIAASASMGPVRGRGGTCSVPARVRAPRGLVVGHPEGSWFLPTGWEAVQQKNAIYRQACGPPGGSESAPC